MLVKTKTVENFVKEIQKNGEGIFRGKEQSGNYIHQLHQDIYYYLSPLVNGENSNKIMAVLTQENLKEDMQTLLDIDIKMHHHNNENKMYDKYLSTSSINTLNEIISELEKEKVEMSRQFEDEEDEVSALNQKINELKKEKIEKRLLRGGKRE